MERSHEHEDQLTKKDDPQEYSDEAQTALKHPMMFRQEGAEEEEEVKSKKQGDHVCVECGKVFSSGKALGGHISSGHVQANKGYNLKKLKSDRTSKSKKSRKGKIFDGKDNDNNGSSYGGSYKGFARKINCFLCGKKFPSKKSLFGHMRCHPERDWRGMVPPAETTTKAEEFEVEPDDQESSEHDHQIGSAPMAMTPLKDWPLKARRGGVGVKGTSTSAPTVVTPAGEEELDACHQLISLGNGVPARNCLSDDGKLGEGEEAEGTSSNSLSPEAAVDEEAAANRVEAAYLLERGRLTALRAKKFEARLANGAENVPSAHSRNNKGKRKASPDEICKPIELSKQYDNGNSSETESDNNFADLRNLRNQRNQVNKMVETKKKREKTRQIDSNSGYLSPVNAATPGKYKCEHCHKCFTSYQALGGHKSSHNKFKLLIHNTIDDQFPPAASSVGGLNHPTLGTQLEGTKQIEQGAEGYKAVENNTHQCHQCSICDKVFLTGQALGGHKRSHYINGSTEDASPPQMMIHRNLGFDLNEIPKEDN